MKDVESTRSGAVMRSVGRYICSFGLGFALGPFISGWIREYLQWNIAFVFAAALALLVAVLALFLNPERGSRSAKSARVSVEEKPELTLPGWAGALVGSSVMSLFLTVFPEHSESIGLSPAFRGSVIFLMGVAQALVAFVYSKSGHFVNRRDIIPLLNIPAVIAFTILYFLKDPFLFFISSILFGIFVASFFFVAIYHSLSHVTKSVRNIAINETVIGLGFLLGPQAIRLIPAEVNFRSAYIIAIFPLVAVVIVQFAMMKNTAPEKI
jgi:predicted MFS family arabinose efflux permease